jgi:glutathione peroxidase
VSLYEIPLTTLDGEHTTLEPYRDQVLLIVNVASRCGFTPQYAGLESLYRTNRQRGFSVLGFPCNQFAGQEPGDAEEIKAFCSREYNVTFPVFAKIDVNGPDAHPLYRLLKQAKQGLLGTRTIKWNFTKFLIGRDGGVLKRYSPRVVPAALEPDLERALRGKEAV